MAKQRITLKIAHKEYPLTIESEKEEMYRHAERELNALVTRCEQANYKGFTVQDCLAIAALQMAINKVTLERDREIGSEELREVAELSDRLATYLDAPET